MSYKNPLISLPFNALGRYSGLELLLKGVDVFITPSYGGDVLLMTNLTGHPVVVVPSGFNEAGSPVSISFVGGLWKEAEALRVAKAWQEATGHHTRHPPLFSV